jgi:hypothetical protein
MPNCSYLAPKMTKDDTAITLKRTIIPWFLLLSGAAGLVPDCRGAGGCGGAGWAVVTSGVAITANG